LTHHPRAGTDEEWKAYSGNETSKKGSKFESIILKQAQEKTRKTTNVQVYELGRPIIVLRRGPFCHASIIPAHLKIQCVPC
jgi:hypothetical protein